MRKSFNKYLFYTGWGLLVSFIVFIIIININKNEGQYKLSVFNGLQENIGKQIEGLKDQNHKINYISYNDFDGRIKLSSDCYVLKDRKSNDIILITNKVDEINKLLESGKE